ncbi:MAG: D-alanyl-D-alanine carboxypeptidase family protein [Rhodocyclaceae bacterium]
MRRLLAAALAALCGVGIAHAQVPPSPVVPAKSWVLFDLAGNQQLAAQDAQMRVDPGVLTQLMTAYVGFTAVRTGQITLDQQVTPGKAAVAAARNGPALFLTPGKPVPVATLLDGVAVLGAGDAAYALAEAVAGSEAAFVELMNTEAQRLGMPDTVFKNATGATVAGQYSTARDLAVLATAMVRMFPQDYARFGLKSIAHRDLTQQSRNRLLWLDASIDGLGVAAARTGGNMVAASAVRGPRRLVAVVAGAPSAAQASQSAQQLLNFAFQSYDAVKLYGAGQPVRRLTVWKGAQREVEGGFLRDLVIAVPRDEAGGLKLQFVGREPMVAPLVRGDRIGTLRVTLEGRTLGEYPVVALGDVPPAGWFGRTWDQLRLWLK